MSDLEELAAVGSSGSDPLSAASGSNVPGDASKQPPQSVVDEWNSALNAAKLDKAAQDAGWQPISPKPWPAAGGGAPGQSDADYAAAARDVAARRVRQAVQPHPSPPLSNTELSQEHGTHGWWGETAIAWLGGTGLASDVTKYSSGTATVGFNLNNIAKSRIYVNGWHGNQYVKAGEIATGAEVLSKGAGALSIVLDGIGWATGHVSSPKFATDTAVTTVGVAGGLPGSVFAGGYYALDTFYPGGPVGAMNDWANNVDENRKIIPNWTLFDPGKI